jgi:hypothetical protein
MQCRFREKSHEKNKNLGKGRVSGKASTKQ